MAFLARSLSLRRAALVAAAVLLPAGCILVNALIQTEKPFAFSHQRHLEEGLDCADCHGQWEESDEPGFPAAAQCALCHADIDAEKPPDRQVATLFAGEQFRAAHAGRQSAEILFSHKNHATRGTECIACHAAVASDDGTLARRASELRTSMEACLACHAGNAGPDRTDCGACHAEIRAGVAPPSHVANWTRYHGTVVRARSPERKDQCSLCHAESDCTTCHHVQPPENHDNYWRRRGHALLASMDRQSCATCHDTDSCQRCHEDIRPASHVGNWGEPRDQHCLACHEPLRSDSCSVCHASTSSHELATPLPGDHLPGMDCRQCHGHGQPLPHVDNGETCTTCHR